MTKRKTKVKPKKTSTKSAKTVKKGTTSSQLSWELRDTRVSGLPGNAVGDFFLRDRDSYTGLPCANIRPYGGLSQLPHVSGNDNFPLPEDFNWTERVDTTQEEQHSDNGNTIPFLGLLLVLAGVAGMLLAATQIFLN